MKSPVLIWSTTSERNIIEFSKLLRYIEKGVISRGPEELKRLLVQLNKKFFEKQFHIVEKRVENLSEDENIERENKEENSE